MGIKSITVTIIALILSISTAQSAIVNPGDVYRTDFDFSSDPFGGPYSILGYRLQIGSDGLGTGDGYVIRVYDSNDVFQGENTFTNNNSFEVSSTFQNSGVTLSPVMTETIGYALISGNATFDMLAVRLVLIDGSIATEFSTMPLIKVVPIPSAVWLFGSGLIGLIGLARRKAHV